MIPDRVMVKRLVAEDMPLSPREAEILAVMLAFDEELIYERGSAYVGLIKVSARLVFSLIRKAAVSESSPGPAEHYRINSTGCKLLSNHWGIER